MEGRCTSLTQKGQPCKRYAINEGKCKIHGTEKVYQYNKQCITLTFSNVVENSVGMEQIGSILDYKPFTIDDLKLIHDKYDGLKEMIYLDLPEDIRPIGPAYEPAAVLVLRDFHPISMTSFEKFLNLDWDTKALMKGEVKNKLSRYNLCFADFEQEPDYANGKGRVIKISTIDELVDIQNKIGILTGFEGLKAEGNLYFDIEKCGIGWHGDKERNIVIGYRLGDSINLCFSWFYKTNALGNKFTINLNHGDLYIMSEKAVGNDWIKRSQLTLRHSAGCAKYTLL